MEGSRGTLQSTKTPLCLPSAGQSQTKVLKFIHRRFNRIALRVQQIPGDRARGTIRLIVTAGRTMSFPIEWYPCCPVSPSPSRGRRSPVRAARLSRSPIKKTCIDGSRRIDWEFLRRHSCDGSSKGDQQRARVSAPAVLPRRLNRFSNSHVHSARLTRSLPIGLVEFGSLCSSVSDHFSERVGSPIKPPEKDVFDCCNDWGLLAPREHSRI